MQNKQQKAPRQELKEATKKAKKAKVTVFVFRPICYILFLITFIYFQFDPANQKTILELQVEKADLATKSAEPQLEDTNKASSMFNITNYYNHHIIYLLFYYSHCLYPKLTSR